MTKKELLLSAVAVVALCTLPNLAYAQTAPATSASDDNTVVVTGIRKSIRQSLDIKKQSVNSVDSIASEDLGKMPDQNVAESLQRVPGITIDRTNGVGNGVTVRGLGPEFNTVTINGRIMATDSAGREFNFDTLAPELIVGANVYKSPQANLEGASIGATIDIRTMRPLDQKRGIVFGGSVRENFAQLGNTREPSASAFFNWKNDAGNFGVSVVGSFDHTDQRTDVFSIGASTGTRGNTPSDNYYAGRTTSNLGYFAGVMTPHNLSPYVDTDDRERSGIDATAQWKPNDDLLITVDAFASHLKENELQTGPSPDFSGGTLVDQVIDGGTTENQMINGVSTPVHVGGTAVYQRFTGGTVDEIVYALPRDTHTSLLGFNAKWTHDRLQLVFDANTTSATRDGLGDAFTTIRRTGMDFFYDMRSGSPIYNWGYSNPNYANAPTDTSHVGAHFMSVGGSKLTDHTHEIKVDAKWSGDNIDLYGGLAYQDRSKDTYSTNFNANGSSYCAYCGGAVILPSSLFQATSYNYFPDQGGSFPRNWITYDTNALIAELKTLSPGPGGAYGDPSYDPAASSHIMEKVTIGYLMAEFHGSISDMPLAINTGVRIENTDYTSSGAGQSIVSATVNGTGQETIVLSPTQPISFGGKYTDILPSFNARLNLTDELIWRASASRVMSRPTLTDLSPAQSISSNPGNELITRGNPDLLPFRASQFESGLEWYFDKLSILSVTGFYKSIDSFVARTSNSTQTVGQVTFHVNQPVNGKGATVKGFELAYREVFSHLPAPWDGLGVDTSYTYTSSDADYSNAGVTTHYGLLGLSQNSYTFEGFYEKGPIQARIAYTRRDKYLVNIATQTSQPEFSNGYDQLDAGVSYALNDHWSIALDGLNLGNSNEFTYAGIQQYTQNFRNVGRRYTLSARFKY